MDKKSSIVICLILIIPPLVSLGCTSYQVPKNIDTLAGSADTDKDGLSDQQELIAMTDARNPDTDGDGLKDGSEIAERLDPKNPDTDGDSVPDSEDAWPRLNNNRLYLSSGISLAILSLTTTIAIHMKFGLTEPRRKTIKIMLEKQKEGDALFRQVRDKIEKLAQQKYGRLVLEEAAQELGIDPALLAKFFARFKARKEGSVYHFGDIEKSYRK